jgi:hypothetical protein
MAHKFRYLCLGGTGGRIHEWAHNPGHPFQRALMDLGGVPILLPGDGYYTWSGKLGGMFWTGDLVWHQVADEVCDLLAPIPYEDRIVFAHSNGGQPAIILARNGFKLRTLTTFATPVRPNLGPSDAINNIGFWQHVYDPKRDWIATLKRGLGGIGGGSTFGSRDFKLHAPNYLSIAMRDVRHSRVFTSKLVELRQAGVLHRAFQLG